MIAYKHCPRLPDPSLSCTYLLTRSIMAETTAQEAIVQPNDNPADTLAQLNHLKASATQAYSLKNYPVAADLYSEATELQAQLHGEMSPENAELLYHYGRCLYKVAVSNSDVLGGKVAGEEPKKKKQKTASAGVSGEATKGTSERTAEKPVEAVVGNKSNNDAAAQQTGKQSENADKPFFQITGDENWTDSEEEADGEGEAGDAEEEEEDDFAIAYEILDVARVLLGKQLETLEDDSQEAIGKGKSKATTSPSISPEKRTVMERLADTHDLQAEISLENERFADAVTDSRSALDLKLQLFPQENSLIAEAHFKLSLALEFASVTTVQAEGEGAAEAAAAEKTAQVDEEARRDAATQMESAIASCKLRVEKERGALGSLGAGEKKEREKGIKDVEEMVQDMEQRVSLTRWHRSNVSY